MKLLHKTYTTHHTRTAAGDEPAQILNRWFTDSSHKLLPMRATGIRTIDRPDAYEKNEWNREERWRPQHREKEFIYRFDESNHGVHGWLLSSNTFHGIAIFAFRHLGDSHDGDACHRLDGTRSLNALRAETTRSITFKILTTAPDPPDKSQFRERVPVQTSDFNLLDKRVVKYFLSEVSKNLLL